MILLTLCTTVTQRIHTNISLGGSGFASLPQSWVMFSYLSLRSSMSEEGEEPFRSLRSPSLIPSLRSYHLPKASKMLYSSHALRAPKKALFYLGMRVAPAHHSIKRVLPLLLAIARIDAIPRGSARGHRLLTLCPDCSP